MEHTTPKPTTDLKTLLIQNGWNTECESPHEIRNEDGSFATGQAADMVVECIKSGWYDE